MRLVKTIVCVSSLAFGSLAYAQDPPTPPPEGTQPPPAATATAAPPVAGGGGYMGPELNRTLTLPPGGIEGEFAPLILSKPSNGDTGESMALGGRYGLMPNVNAGALLAFRLTPDGTLTDFLVDGQYEFMPGSMMMAAGRADLGITHTSAGMVSSTAFDIGLGVPFKYVLSPMLALTSGSQYMITPMGLVATQDILFFELSGDFKDIVLTIPVGVLVQVMPMFNLQLGTGFQLVHVSTDVGSADNKFVPLNITAAANLNVGGVGIDPYFTFSIPGQVGADMGGPGYGDLLLFFVGARVHL